MSAVKDYANEYITTLQGEMPISVALLVLKYRYEDDIVASLYDYAFVNQAGGGAFKVQQHGLGQGAIGIAGGQQQACHIEALKVIIGGREACLP